MSTPGVRVMSRAPEAGLVADVGDVVVLVGTTKGLFALTSDADRGQWTLVGPWFRGEEVAAAAVDTRGGRTRLLAAGMSWHWGPSVYRSDDLGVTWSEPDPGTLAFPAGTGATLARVWQLQPGAEAAPGVVYAGAEPAALFRSDDGGDTFTLDEGLWGHPHRPRWQPGGGGLCLHTVVPDPDGGPRVGVAISSAGFYRTTDGDRWEAANAGITTPFLGEEAPEFGQCVHKVSRHPAEPDTLFCQHHWGVYRSEDFGGTWTEVGEGALPSTFGFPVVADPNQPGTAYVVPLTSDEFRASAEGRLRVYRTTDRGGSWEPLGDGLPQSDAYLCVLRDAFAADTHQPTGLYLGTRTGDVFASADAGQSWRALARDLPPVLCVKTGVLP